MKPFKADQELSQISLKRALLGWFSGVPKKTHWSARYLGRFTEFPGFVI